MAEFQSKFTGQEIENTIDKLRNWLAAGVDGTYPTVTISSVTYDVIWKVIPTPGAKCYGIGLDRTTGRPYEIYYNGSSYKATALDTDTKNTAGSTNSTSKLYLVGANTQAENPQTFSNSAVYTQNGKLYSNNTEVSVEGHTHDGEYVKKSGDTMTGNLTPATNKGASLGTSSLYWSNIYGTTIYENGKSLADKYASKTNIPEAYLTWGGKNFSGNYGPIDAAMVPELGANRLAFMPANAVTIEYSRDGGATWTDYGATDSQKINLFNGNGSSFTIGKAASGAGNIATNKYQLRVNVYTSVGRVYTALNKFVIYLSTSGTNNNWCTIRARTQSDYTAGNDKWTTFADKISVSGWSGYNVINTSGITTYGNTASAQYGHIQFIFGCDTGSTNNSYAGLNINKIFGFGGVGWTTPSTMAKTGHMYTYDSSQNVTFPEGVSAKSFTEGGKSLASKYAAKSHTHNYAGSNSAGGPANSVKNALTFGSKTYNGSSAQTITLDDLGGQAKGDYAILGSNGKLDESVIPAVAITDTYVVATEAEMLALDAQKGDIAIRSDLNKSFVLQSTPASTLANWKELLTPTDAVLSVNGKTGAVTLNLDDINDGSTRKLSGYVTGPSSSTANAVPRYADTTGKKLKDSGVTISDANVLSAAQLAANIIETGTGDNNYFQSRKFRGEGNAATYYHAVDFGFAGHNQVDFYEYGGVWNFWKNTEASATSDSNNLCLQIGNTYVKNKGNTFTWPTTGGTLALTADLPTQATSTKLGLVKSSTTGTAANRDYNVQVNSDGTMKVNVPWTYINTSHSHSAGVGLVGSGRAGASGTYTYKAKLRSETALTVDSAAATTSGNVYPVAVDKSGYLSLNVPLAGFEDILKGIKGRTQVEWNALNAGEYGSNSTYNGATLPPIVLENTSGFWNSASGRPLDISFHFTKKERITTLQVKCPPYSGVNPTMTVYYAQKGDAGLTLYKEIATISTADRKAYEFNEEGISADYWVVRFTSSGWIDLRLCSPSGLFTTGLYTEECHQQIMDRFNGYQPVGNYQPKGDYVTYDNASKDIYLGSHGIHSGTRPSSGGATLAGNGYWIQESSVGVSSAVSGGVAVSSEMTPNYVSVSNGKITINSSGIVSDAGTFTFDGNPGSVATSEDLKNYQKTGNYVTIDTAQTITGRKTFNSPANVNGQEVATAIFKTSNGGRLIIGKEGPNSGTMLRFDQTAGTTRLQFRASATPGAMVWTQPEKGAKLYFDLTNSAGVSTRTTLDARSGTIARTSDIGNGKITIQKNGTDIGSFTTNQSGSKTIDLTLGVSDVSGLQSTLNGKMDTYTITSRPSSMGKNGFAQFEYDVAYQLTQYSELKEAFGYVKVLEKGGQVSNNNSYFTGFGNVGGGTYIGTATYDRDYNYPDDALVASHGLLIDNYGSAFLLYGSRDGETKKELATKDDTNSLQNSINGKANKTHTHAISDISNLQSTLNGKANASHTHTISQITNLQTTLDNKQNKIEYPCSFDDSSSKSVKLSRDGTDNFYVHIQRGDVTYNGSTTQYPEINVTFPQAFNGKPTVIVSFAPTSNSTGTYEALKVINVTKTGFTVITRMSASISGGYFRVNWIAIHTV